MKTKAITVRTFTALLVALAICACGERKPPRPEQMQLSIEGMHCEGCAEGITAALTKKRGVIATDVHFSNAVQTIQYDANRLSPAELSAVITGRGFTIKPAGAPTKTSQ